MALADKIRQIDDLKRQLDGLTPMFGEQQQKLDEKLRLEFHYNTNHIEGNTLTYGETKLAILFDQVSEGHSLREYEEMKASDVAYKYVQGLAKETERPLTESFIKELNQILLVREFYKEAITESGEPTSRLISVGEYKKHPNSVRLQNGEMFHYASPAETPAKMTDMLAWYREEEEKKEHHPVMLAALLHYRFVLIHPFDDGNGRVSRLLMNYVLFRNGFPLVVIKSDDKANYLRALNRADIGDEPAFVEYIADQLIWSLELSLKAAKGEDIEEQQDWKKKLALLDRELSVNDEIHLAHSKPVVDAVIEDKILPLFKKIIQETILFNQMFMTNYCELFNVDDKKTVNFNNEDNISMAYINYRHDYYNGIGLSKFLFQFKKNGADLLNIVAKIKVEFSHFQYNIFVSDVSPNSFKFLVGKFYHESLTEIETNDIISAFANHLLYTIEFHRK